MMTDAEIEEWMTRYNERPKLRQVVLDLLAEEKKLRKQLERLERWAAECEREGFVLSLQDFTIDEMNGEKPK